MKFIIRLLLSFLIIAILAIIISLITNLVFITRGETHFAGRAGSIISLFIFTLTPAVFIATLTPKDSKKTRFFIAIETIIIIAVFSTLWISRGHWIITTFFNDSKNTVQLFIALDILITKTLMLLSGIFVAYNLPSLKSSQVESPPKSIKKFKILMYIYLGIRVIVKSGVWPANQAAFSSTIVTSTPSLNLTPVTTFAR